MRVLSAFIVLFLSALEVASQTTDLQARRITAIDSLRINGNWVKRVVRDSSLQGDSRDLASVDAIRQHVANRFSQIQINFQSLSGSPYSNQALRDALDSMVRRNNLRWDSIIGRPSNFTTTYALSNDLRDSLTNRYTKAQSDLRYVPYIGATSPLNLGGQNLYGSASWENTSFIYSGTRFQTLGNFVSDSDSSGLFNSATGYKFYAVGAGLNAWYTPQTIVANQFVKIGGTSSQFLKADGSVDGTGYLPLTGGTLSATGSGTNSYLLSSVYNNAEGTVKSIQNTNSTGWSAYRFFNESGVRTGSVGSGNSNAAQLRNAMYVVSQNNFPLILGTSTGTNPIARVWISPSTGNVVVGDTIDNGVNRLQVNGSIAASSVRVNNGSTVLGNFAPGTTNDTAALVLVNPLAPTGNGTVVTNTNSPAIIFEGGAGSGNLFNPTDNRFQWRIFSEPIYGNAGGNTDANLRFQWRNVTTGGSWTTVASFNRGGLSASLSTDVITLGNNGGSGTFGRLNLRNNVGTTTASFVSEGVNSARIEANANSGASLLFQLDNTSGGLGFRVRLTNAGMFMNSIGVTTGNNSASAMLHLAGGGTAAGRGQIKLNGGSRLTTPEDGSLSHVSGNLEFTAASTVFILAKSLQNTQSLDFDSIAAGAAETLTVTVTGAQLGDAVSIGVPNDAMTSGLIYTAWVSAANTVSVQAYNSTGSAIDPASGTFRIILIR